MKQKANSFSKPKTLSKDRLKRSRQRNAIGDWNKAKAKPKRSRS